MTQVCTGSDGARFFFGDRPSSLDALLFAHLLYLQTAPVAAPELRSKVRAHVCRPLLAMHEITMHVGAASAS